jgi:HAD superfamily hydrolase (TIGR01490 family)|tara:strand:- start:12 stop:680 length:669 start_codon:yes stop_codon:yes gene_type:complete
MSKPDLAIFDLDNTILNGDSDYSMINYLIDINLLGKNAKLKNEQFIQDYQRGQLDFNQYTNFALKPYIGMTQKEINEIIMPFVENIIEPMINIFALKLLHEHYEKEHKLLLASATNELIVKPIAKRLEIKNVIATKVEFKNNKCTGEFIPPSALGEGKLQLVKSWMKYKQRNSFSRVTFYSDSINDLPLLEAVEFPIAVNPDQTLEEIARDRGWKIITLPRI